MFRNETPGCSLLKHPNLLRQATDFTQNTTGQSIALNGIAFDKTSME